MTSLLSFYDFIVKFFKVIYLKNKQYDLKKKRKLNIEEKESFKFTC